MKRLAIFLLPLMTACAVNPVTGRNELALFAVSSEEEVALGKKIFPQALQQMGGGYPDPELDRYVAEVGLTLAKKSERPALPWQFRVANDSTPNAFALPGGQIAITRGLLVNLQSEAELAAVLGHEIGHVTARHAVAGLQRSNLLSLGLTVVAGATQRSSYSVAAQQVGALAGELLEMRYSRDQERDCDRLGIDYMAKAGYDPRGAVHLQEFFSRQLEGGKRGGWLEGMFRSHPFSAERLSANRDYVAQRYPGASGGAERLRAQPFLAATERLRGVQPAYALYAQAQALERKGDLRQAIVTYLQASAAGGDEALILTGLGMAYLQADDLATARQHLTRAIKLDGNYYLSRLGLGYLYLQQGETAKALVEVEASMALLPTLQGGYLLGEGYAKSNRPAEAAEQYRAVAAADPKGKLGRDAALRLQQLGVR